MSSSKKNDDIIEISEERVDDTFEFSEDPMNEEIPVQKPGMLEKREKRRSRGPDGSRAVVSEDQEYFDIE